MIRADSRTVCVRTLSRTLLVLPFVVLPFVIWTSETWLHMQIFSNDYELTNMRTEQDRIHAHIKQLEDRSTHLKTLRQLEASERNRNMGLIEPEPGQIRVIRLSESDLQPQLHINEAPHRFADASLSDGTSP